MTTMTAWEIYFWGFGGSLAVEIVAWSQYYAQRPVVLPPRYKMAGFYVSRLLLAAVGGGLALAYEIQKPLLAANIGAATPLLIQALSQGLRFPTDRVGNGQSNEESPKAD